MAQRTVGVALILVVIGTCLMGKEAAMAGMHDMKIAMIIASKDFRDEEFAVPCGIFKKAGATVTVASSSLRPAKGTLGTVVTPEALYTDIDPKAFDAVLFVGGGGAEEYWNDPKAHAIARKTLEAKKVLAAICIAPVTLANAGLLKGKRATVWPSEGRRLAEHGAIYTAAPVEVDGAIITASGPKHAKDFAEAIVAALARSE